MTIESWDNILRFVAVTNRFNLESFRAAPMASSVNGTDHGLLRAVSSKVEIAKVARHAGQLLLCRLIIIDLARTWPCVVGTGSQLQLRCVGPICRGARDCAIARFKATGERAFKLTVVEGGVRSVEAAIADCKALRDFSERTNMKLQEMRLSFRDITVKKDKFGRPDHMRRSALARSMVSPSILVNPSLKGAARAFEAQRIFLVDDNHAARLDCGITETIAIVKPKPHDGTLELMITFCQQEAIVFTAPRATVAADRNARAFDLRSLFFETRQKKGPNMAK